MTEKELEEYFNRIWVNNKSHFKDFSWIFNSFLFFSPSSGDIRPNSSFVFRSCSWYFISAFISSILMASSYTQLHLRQPSTRLILEPLVHLPASTPVFLRVLLLSQPFALSRSCISLFLCPRNSAFPALRLLATVKRTYLVFESWSDFVENKRAIVIRYGLLSGFLTRCCFLSGNG